MTVSHVWCRKNDNNVGDIITKMNYDIHTEAVLGLPGKIFACFFSLLLSSLPISGGYIWWGGNKKRKH